MKKIIEVLLLDKLFYRVFFLNIIKREIKGQHKILELGAGRHSYIRDADKSIEITAIDIFDPSIQFATENNIYNYYIKGDVDNLLEFASAKSFDSVVAFDLIEHLTKEKGFRLIENMTKVAKQNIIIYTPNGFLQQKAHDGNPFQEHVSGWSYNEMKKLGFKIYGVNGYKKLRKEYALPKVKPYLFGNFLSNLSIIFLKMVKREDLSFAILCIKKI